MMKHFDRYSSAKLNLLKIAVVCVASAVLLGGYAHADNSKKVALVMKALTNPFFFKMQEGAKLYAEQNHIDLEVFGIERETDAEQQIAIMENLIARRYGAIVLAPADSERLIPVCKMAMENNIAVINIDNPLNKPTLDKLGLSIPFVGSDNRAGAALVGAYIKDELGGEGRVLLIEGIRGAENARLRREGFTQTIEGMEIVANQSANWHTDEAFSLVNSLLDTHGKVDAVLCANDNMALGALRALDLRGWGGQVLVGGYDNIDAVRQALSNSRIHATVEQHPELMGEYGVALAAEVLDGNEVPLISDTPLDLITHETFGQSIGLSISNIKNSFFSLLKDGAEAQATLLGIKLIVTDAEDNDAKQLSDLLEFIEQGVAAVIVNPTNTDTVVPGIELANSRKVAVFTVDRTVSGGEVVSRVESDNEAGGRLAAQLLARHLGGRGWVVELEGIPGASATIDRGTGFNKELGKYPDIEIVERESAHFQRAMARSTIDRLEKEKTTYDAIFAHNDDMIMGALEALQERGNAKGKVLIGFDGMPEAVKAVKDARLTATIAQVPKEMGRLVVKNAADYLRGANTQKLILVQLKAIEK